MVALTVEDFQVTYISDGLYTNIEVYCEGTNGQQQGYAKLHFTNEQFLNLVATVAEHIKVREEYVEFQKMKFQKGIANIVQHLAAESI